MGVSVSLLSDILHCSAKETRDIHRVIVGKNHTQRRMLGCHPRQTQRQTLLCLAALSQEFPLIMYHLTQSNNAQAYAPHTS